MLLFGMESLHRLISLQNVHEVFNASWQVLQTVDGWLGGSGKAQLALELRSDKHLLLKDVCAGKSQGKM